MATKGLHADAPAVLTAWAKQNQVEGYDFYHRTSAEDTSKLDSERLQEVASMNGEILIVHRVDALELIYWHVESRE
jgi:hypothetical protein